VAKLALVKSMNFNDLMSELIEDRFDIDNLTHMVHSNTFYPMILQKVYTYDKEKPNYHTLD